MNDARDGSASEPVPVEDANQPLRPLSRLTSAPRQGIRVPDGDRSWGSVKMWPGQDGVLQYRLVVFPPGITGAERRLLRLSRAWPAWGAALWLISEICLTSPLGPSAAFGISTMAYLGLEAVLVGTVGALNLQVRRLSVALVAGYTDRSSAAVYAKIKALVDTLTQADAMCAQGQMTAVDHEATWWQVYDRLRPGNPEAIEEQPSV